jgi:hypothetical protein
MRRMLDAQPGATRARGPLGYATEAIRTGRRDGGSIGKEQPMTPTDIPLMWPDAILDIGPIELSNGHWGVVGLIPYDGHVVLAVSPTRPSWSPPCS